MRPKGYQPTTQASEEKLESKRIVMSGKVQVYIDLLVESL